MNSRRGFLKAGMLGGAAAAATALTVACEQFCLEKNN